MLIHGAIFFLSYFFLPLVLVLFNRWHHSRGESTRNWYYVVWRVSTNVGKTHKPYIFCSLRWFHYVYVLGYSIVSYVILQCYFEYIRWCNIYVKLHSTNLYTETLSLETLISNRYFISYVTLCLNLLCLNLLCIFRNFVWKWQPLYNFIWFSIINQFRPCSFKRSPKWK